MKRKPVITLTDGFFAPRQRTNITTTIPYCIRRCEETGRIDAFKLQWTPENGLPYPHIFWDSDVAKVMEGMAYIAADSPAVAARLEELVDLVVSAQQPDGYLNTHYSVMDQDKRWSNLAKNHELYCAGHLIEAAAAHFEATGKRKFLDAAIRYADYICAYFGEDGCQGYPGHEELELALCRLCRITGDKKYLRQAKRFIDRRGTTPNYFVEKENFDAAELDFCQAHKPVREQTEAEGHAVRVLYLLSGMADVAAETGDGELLAVCERLFDDLTEHKIFITGGVGSRQIGEYVGGTGEQVPERSYTESCAAIAMVLFSHRMLKITGKSKYADAMERTLFNCAMSGLSLSGDKFFYGNLHASYRTMKPQGFVNSVRQPWYGCSCCPTNYCRFLPQIGGFCFRAGEGSLTVDIPVSADIETDGFAAKIISDYPYDGNVTLRIIRGGKLRLALRIPSWCTRYTLPECGEVADGFWSLTKEFADGEEFRFDFTMTPTPVFADIPSTRLQAALCRGPLVYCVELPMDSPFSPFELALTDETEFALVPAEGLPEGTPGIRFSALRFPRPGKLYTAALPAAPERVTVTAIPYALWQNRGCSEMTVFMPFIPKIEDK